MPKKANLLNPFPGKCDLIEGILIGKKQTNNLNKLNQNDHRPSLMVRKLNRVAEETTCLGLKNKAIKAVELLETLPGDSPVSERDRVRIFQHVKSL